MIEHCCLQLGQQAAQEANSVSISVQKEEQPHVKRTIPREHLLHLSAGRDTV